MENKRTKKVLDDEMLDGVTGGNGGNDGFYRTEETNDEAQVNMIQSGFCPYYNQYPSEHSMLESDGSGYLCKRCGIRWVIIP